MQLIFVWKSTACIFVLKQSVYYANVVTNSLTKYDTDFSASPKHFLQFTRSITIKDQAVNKFLLRT